MRVELNEYFRRLAVDGIRTGDFLFLVRHSTTEPEVLRGNGWIFATIYIYSAFTPVFCLLPSSVVLFNTGTVREFMRGIGLRLSKICVSFDRALERSSKISHSVRTDYNFIYISQCGSNFRISVMSCIQVPDEYFRGYLWRHRRSKNQTYETNLL